MSRHDRARHTVPRGRPRPAGAIAAASASAAAGLLVLSTALAAAVAAAGLSGCRSTAGTGDSPAAATVAPGGSAPRTAGAVRRPPTVAPVRTSTTSGIRVAPSIRMPNGALLLTLTPAQRDEALLGAPAAVGTLDHRAVGPDPAGLLDRYFRDTSRGLHARVRVTESDVDRRAGDGVTVEGFRYRIDVFVHAEGATDEILLAERGEGEAVWVQPDDAASARWRERREEALPRLARLAFQAALTSLQTRVRDRRDQLMELARDHRRDEAPDADTPDAPLEDAVVPPAAPAAPAAPAVPLKRGDGH